MLKCVYCDKNVHNDLEYYFKENKRAKPIPLPVCNEKHLNLYLLGLVFWYPLPILED